MDGHPSRVKNITDNQLTPASDSDESWIFLDDRIGPVVEPKNKHFTADTENKENAPIMSLPINTTSDGDDSDDSNNELNEENHKENGAYDDVKENTKV